MDWWQALILGIVEGLTEYLPVSSTGHLLLTQRIMGIGASEVADAFAICIQAGAIVAVLGLYRNRVLQMIAGVLGHEEDGRRLAINIVAAFIPAAIAGLLLEKHIKHFLFGAAWGLWPTVIAWFVGGLAILGAAWFRRARREHHASGFALEHLTWKHAVIIGVAQCIAMWPGTSRSLVTIVGGILVGLSMASAVEFSFLLGVVTLGAATAKDGLEHGAEMLQIYGPLSIAVGFLGAWISAVLAVKWMVAYLNRHGLSIFGYYRIILALAVGAMIFLGFMEHESAPATPKAPRTASAF